MSGSPRQPQTSGLAIASLALSCLSFVLGPFGCISGIICGHIARSQCSKDPALTGNGIALAGLIVGYSFLGLMVTVICIVVALSVMAEPTSAPFVYPMF
jgi:F0F1-type ATP synthase membrane subunit c/vacuolar-type H+-ATPase subunit K